MSKKVINEISKIIRVPINQVDTLRLSKLPNKSLREVAQKLKLNTDPSGGIDELIVNIRLALRGEAYKKWKEDDLLKDLSQYYKPLAQMTKYVPDDLHPYLSLLYLAEKYKNTCFILPDKNVHYRTFETLWTDMGFCDPYYSGIFMFTETKNGIDQFDKYMNTSCQHIIIPITLSSEGLHQNIIIVDKKNKTMERFEPHGDNSKITFKYNTINLDQKLNEIAKYYKLTYLPPGKILPKDGYQSIEAPEVPDIEGDPGGYCNSWALFWVDLRLGYPDVDQMFLAQESIKKIKRDVGGLRAFIRNYSQFLYEEGQKFLKDKSQHILPIDFVNMNVPKWFKKYSRK